MKSDLTDLNANIKATSSTGYHIKFPNGLVLSVEVNRMIRHPNVDLAESLIDEIDNKMQELADLVDSLEAHADPNQSEDYTYSDFQYDVNNAYRTFQGINTMGISEIAWLDYTPKIEDLASAY